jgi:hypothetical protein
MPPAGSRNNRPDTPRITPLDCIDALSAHLGSQLLIHGLRSIDETQNDENTQALTHLSFRHNLSNGQDSVQIYLVRNGDPLTVNEVALPYERDPLDMLFRAVATAARAARDWSADTPAANDPDTRALRDMVLGGNQRITIQPGMQTGWDAGNNNVSSTSDAGGAGRPANAHDALSREIELAVSRHDDGRSAQPGVPAAAHIAVRRPHAIPPVAPPTSPSGQAGAAQTGQRSAAPSSTSRGIKRRLSSETTEAVPTAAAAPVSGKRPAVAPAVAPAFPPAAPPSYATATAHRGRPA